VTFFHVKDVPVAHARSYDPQTSHDAAESVWNLTGVQERILALFEYRENGYTDEELIQDYFKAHRHLFPATDSSLRSRRSELVHRGELTDTGVKRLTRVGRKTTVWQLAGRLL
jgi:hypothetical protein